jgi:hypothetical protein
MNTRDPRTAELVRLVCWEQDQDNWFAGKAMLHEALPADELDGWWDMLNLVVGTGTHDGLEQLRRAVVDGRADDLRALLQLADAAERTAVTIRRVVAHVEITHPRAQRRHHRRDAVTVG